MAGYQIEIEAPSWTDDLIRALLRGAQRRARALEHLEMRFRRRSLAPGGSAWSVSIDGSGWLIAAWSQQLERDLPIIAEGFHGRVPTAQAVRIAESLVSRWHEVIGDEDNRPRDPWRIRTTAKDENRWLWAVYWWPGPSLTERQTISDQTVARWAVGDLPEEIVVEEVHTMLESALRTATGSGHRVGFPVLLERAFEAGLLNGEQKDGLEDFNEMRRVFRHRNRTIQSDQEREEIRNRMSLIISWLDRLINAAEP